MDYNDIQSILKSIAEVRSVDYDVLIADNYGDSKLEDICFGSYDAIEFKKLYTEILDKLEYLFSSEIKYLLPERVNVSNLNNNISIKTIIDELYSNLNYNSPSGAFKNLESLTSYYLLYGSWEKKITLKPKVDLRTIENLNGELELTYAQFKNKIADINTALENVELLKNQFNNELKSTKAIILELNSDVDEVTKSKNTIDTYVAVSETNKNTIDGAKSNIVEYEETLSKNIAQYAKEFGSIKNQNSTSLKAMSESIALKNEILGYKDEIKRLVGAAADGSLGSKFEERRKDMKTNVIFFIVASILSFLLAGFWAYYVFAHLKVDHTESYWVDFLINIVRTAPAWFLVYWCVKQYTNERKTQEEYAFKSAIAMTLRSYSEMLTNEDEGNPEERATKQLMLLKSIDHIYQKPDLDSKENNVKIESKDLTSTLKELSQIIKDLKS